MGSVTEYRIEGDRQLKVEIYTDGAARGNPDGQAVLERCFIIQMERDSSM